MLSDCSWKADSTVLYIVLNSLHWIPFRSQCSMSVPAFSKPGVFMRFCRKNSFHFWDSYYLVDVGDATTSTLIWFTSLSCRNYPIVLSYVILHLLSILRTFMYSFPFEYFNCGSVESGREGREYIYKVCHFVLNGH